MKKRLWAAKAIAHTSIWLGKRESDFLIEMYGAQKAKGSFLRVKYQKFQAPISKWDVLFKNDQMFFIVEKPNEKLQRFCNHFCGRSYMLISIIEIDYLT